ncbi:hypothetical protein Leryth_016560, partial [Lithospermum erythrorhizon]
CQYLRTACKKVYVLFFNHKTLEENLIKISSLTLYHLLSYRNVHHHKEKSRISIQYLVVTYSL